MTRQRLLKYAGIGVAGLIALDLVALAATAMFGAELLAR